MKAHTHKFIKQTINVYVPLINQTCHEACWSHAQHNQFAMTCGSMWIDNFNRKRDECGGYYTFENLDLAVKVYAMSRAAISFTLAFRQQHNCDEMGL